MDPPTDPARPVPTPSLLQSSRRPLPTVIHDAPHLGEQIEATSAPLHPRYITRFVPSASCNSTVSSRGPAAPAHGRLRLSRRRRPFAPRRTRPPQHRPGLPLADPRQVGAGHLHQHVLRRRALGPPIVPPGTPDGRPQPVVDRRRPPASPRRGTPPSQRPRPSPPARRISLAISGVIAARPPGVPGLSRAGPRTVQRPAAPRPIAPILRGQRRQAPRAPPTARGASSSGTPRGPAPSSTPSSRSACRDPPGKDRAQSSRPPASPPAGVAAPTSGRVGRGIEPARRAPAVPARCAWTGNRGWRGIRRWSHEVGQGPKIQWGPPPQRRPLSSARGPSEAPHPMTRSPTPEGRRARRRAFKTLVLAAVVLNRSPRR